MAKHNVETIPFDAVIKLDVPGSFYARLQQLTIHYSQSRPHEELLKAMEKLKGKDQAESEFEYHIQTLTILMFEIESAAKNQNLLKIQEIDIPEDGSAPTISEN